MAANDSVEVKWKHEYSSGKDSTRRFLLPRTNGYTVMWEKIAQVMPDFRASVFWKDEDDDLVDLSNDEEFAHAVSLPSNQKLFRLFTFDTESATDAEAGVQSSAVVHAVEASPVPVSNVTVPDSEERTLAVETEEFSKGIEKTEVEATFEDEFKKRVEVAVAAALAQMEVNKKEPSPNSNAPSGKAANADDKKKSEPDREPLAAGCSALSNKEEARLPKTGDLGMDFVKELDFQIQKLIAQYGSDTGNATSSSQQVETEAQYSEHVAMRA